MVRRLLLGLAILVALLVVVVLLEPTGVALGLIRQEKFYKGRPTSFWRRALLDPGPGAATNTHQEMVADGPAAVPALIARLHTDQQLEAVKALTPCEPRRARRSRP
jgi:hypothetical protein